MPLTPTTTVDPSVMLNNWKAGVGSQTNANKLDYKYSHPRKAFNADAATSQQRLLDGVQRAVAANKYVSSMNAVDVNKAADNMHNYGIQNWMNSANNKAYKYQAVATALANAITNVKNIVNSMPKGRGQNNRNRMLAWHDNMSNYYGKIKTAA